MDLLFSNKKFKLDRMAMEIGKGVRITYVHVFLCVCVFLKQLCWFGYCPMYILYFLGLIKSVFFFLQEA